MQKLYTGKLEDKAGHLYTQQIEQNMRDKLKEILKQELKLTEENRQGIYFKNGSVTMFYKFSKKQGGQLVELEAIHHGKDYVHKITGYGSSKVMKPLAEKITKLYDEYQLKRDSGGPLKGFEKA